MVCPGNVTSLDITEDGAYIVAAIAEKIYVWQVKSVKCLSLLMSKTFERIRFTVLTYSIRV